MALGLLFLFLALKCAGWETQLPDDRFSSRIMGVMTIILFLPALVCVVISVIPARWLYRIGPNDLPDIDARSAAEVLETLK